MKLIRSIRKKGNNISRARIEERLLGEFDTHGFLKAIETNERIE